MEGVATEDLLLATLSTDASSRRGVDLSTVVDRLAGSGRRLSRQVQVGVAAERLVARGLVRRDSDADGDRLSLTDEGQSRAEDVADRIADRRIELVADGGRREVTVERAATELDRSPVSIATDCSEDDVYYDQTRVDADGLVDRIEERDEFRSVLRRVERTASGELVRLIGPSGSGKTTLANELLRETADAVDVVRMGCRGERTEPYQSVRDALDQLGVEDPFAVTDFQAPDAETYRAQQTGLFTEVTELLAPDAGVRVLFFDDVDHADAATWQYLDFLCERLPEFSLVVVLAHCPGTLPEDAPIHPGRDLPETCIEVTGLDRAATERLVEQVLGRCPVPDAFADAVYERTGGTPVYVESTVQTLIETNQLDPQLQWYPTDSATFDLPDAVEETVRQQVAMFEGDVRNVLEWVAVADGSVPVSVLRTAAEPEPDRVGTILETVAQTGLLERSSRGEQTHVTFRTDVFSDALVDDFSQADRERRHETIARLLEETANESDPTDRQRSADRAATIAYHYERAGDADAAIEWYREAADRATDLHAHETAIDHFYRVIDVARDVDDTEAVLAANERLAAIYTTVGEYDQADKHIQFVRERIDEDDGARSQRIARLTAQVHAARGEYDAAVEAARGGLEGAARPSPEQCRLLMTLADAYSGLSEYESVQEMAERGRELATELGRSDLEADAVHRLGQVALHRGNYDHARECFERSLDICRETGDRQSEADSVQSLGTLAFKRGAYDRGRECHEVALALKREIGDRRGEAKSLHELGNVAFRQGTYDRSRELFEESLDIRQDIGDKHSEGKILTNLGSIVFKQGAYDKAREYFERGLAIRREVGNRYGEALCLHNLGFAACRLGEYDLAREYYERSLSIKQEIGKPRAEAKSLHDLGLVAAREGAYDQAREYYERSLSIRREIGDRQGEVECLTDLGTLAEQRGKRDRAREYYEEGREIAREAGYAGREATSLRGLCSLAREQGAYDRADEYITRALELSADGKGPSETERIRLESARLALDRGNVETAREQGQQARETFAEFGEPLWLGRSRRLLGRIAAADGDPAAAREHFKAAVETFSDIGASDDTLETLERLVETCRAQGDDEQARKWCRRAGDVLADAPAPVADQYGTWAEDCDSTLEES